MFPYSKLPIKLKALSLKSATIDDVPQLLRVNKKIRASLLQNGTFPPRKTDSLVVELPIYRKKISSESPYECVFAISFNGTTIPSFHISESEIEVVSGKIRWKISAPGRVFWSLMGKIISVRRFSLSCSPHFGHGDLAEREFENLLNRFYFLPNLHHVNEWEVTSDSVEFLELSFTRLFIQSFNQLKLKVDWEGKKEKDGKEVKRFLSTLSKCPKLASCCHFIWAGNQIPWRQVGSFNQKLLLYEIEAELWPKFVGSLGKLLAENRLQKEDRPGFLIQSKFGTNESVDELFEEFLDEIFYGIVGVEMLEEEEGKEAEEKEKLLKYLSDLRQKLAKLRLKDQALGVEICDKKRKNCFFRKDFPDQVQALGCASILLLNEKPKNGAQQFVYQIFLKYFRPSRKVSTNLDLPVARERKNSYSIIAKRKVSTDFVRKMSQLYEAKIQENGTRH
ncbi:unnamed protein product, partial [Mesorhabditis belari]|uniref:Uncharacterized protein n=1 Tax=Mesorhabditis belari TaxID=2138241 RepID=A0AAF3J767_9BILA